jgi:plasmid stability protein
MEAHDMAVLNIKGFPDDVYEALRERAGREHRSVAQEVIHLLSREVRAEPRSLLELRGLGRRLRKGVGAARFVAEERASWDD